MYYLSMLLIIASSVLYHVSQHAISKNLSPQLSMGITYATALATTLLAALFIPAARFSLPRQIGYISWPTFLLGFSIVGLELGFLLAYRSGWRIGVAAIISTAAVTVLLIPIGIYFFKDHITMTKVFGILLCLVGIALINK